MDVMRAVPSAGARFFVANFTSHSATGCDALTLKKVGKPISIVFPISVAVAPAVGSNNPRLFVVHSTTEVAEGIVSVFDAVTLKRIGQPIPLAGFHTQIAISADNSLAVVVGQAATALTALDPVTLKQIAQPVPMEGNPAEVVAIASDHSRVFACTATHISAVEPTQVVDKTSRLATQA